MPDAVRTVVVRQVEREGQVRQLKVGHAADVDRHNADVLARGMLQQHVICTPPVQGPASRPWWYRRMKSLMARKGAGWPRSMSSVGAV